MKTVLNNAYWRELLDHIPSFFLVFRLDELEEAELVFVSKQCAAELGWNPAELMQLSLRDAEIKTSCDTLIELIAAVTRKERSNDSLISVWKTVSGEEKSFRVSFEMYKMSSSPAYHISVVLTPTNDKRSPESLTKGKATEKVNRKITAVSELMRSFVLRLHDAVQRSSFILIHGEPQSGKTEILTYASSFPIWDGWSRIILKGNQKPEWTEQVNETQTVLFWEHIHESDIHTQRDIMTKWTQAEKSGKSVVVITTSAMSAEKLVQTDKLLPEWYYQADMIQLAVPPLRFRKEDVKTIVTDSLEKLRDLVNNPRLEYSKECVRFLETAKWPNNFQSLYEFIQESLSYLNGDIIELPDRFRMEEVEQTSLFEETIDSDIMPFDKMVKRYLQEILKKTGGKIYGRDGAARLLRLAPTTLQSKLKRYGIR